MAGSLADGLRRPCVEIGALHPCDGLGADIHGRPATRFRRVSTEGRSPTSARVLYQRLSGNRPPEIPLLPARVSEGLGIPDMKKAPADLAIYRGFSGRADRI